MSVSRSAGGPGTASRGGRRGGQGTRALASGPLVPGRPHRGQAQRPGPSRDALRWAVQQAGLTGATVEAVIAWHFPYLAAGYGWAPVAVMQAPEFGEAAEKLVTDVISSAHHDDRSRRAAGGTYRVRDG